jgi:hypothetical protein
MKNMKEMNKYLSKIFCLSALFSFVIFAYGQSASERTIDSLSFVNKKDSLDVLYGKNKTIPDEYKLCCLIALSYYPELSDSKIIFKNAKIKTTLNTRPTLLSTILKTKSKRTYVIRINDSEKPHKVLMEHANFNSKIGLLGHEFGHIYDYTRKNACGVFDRAVSYLTDGSKRKFEHEIDLTTIEKGLGWQLYDWSYFVLYESCATEKYKKYKQKIYFTPEQLEEQLKIFLNRPLSDNLKQEQK